MRKTARPVVWEGAGAKSPALDLIEGARPTTDNLVDLLGACRNEIVFYQELITYRPCNVRKLLILPPTDLLEF